MSASPSLSPPTCVQQPPDRLPWQQQQGPRLFSIGRPIPKTTIRFKCVDCGRQMEARSQDGGVDTNCLHCSARFHASQRTPICVQSSMSPGQMKAVPFPFPYVPQIVQLIVLTSVLLLFTGLFVTVGSSHRSQVFFVDSFDAQKHLREGSAVERSAQAVSIGIFSLLFVPFWLVQLPFSLIGSLWSSHRLCALATMAVLLSIIYTITLCSPYLIRLLHSF